MTKRTTRTHEAVKAFLRDYRDYKRSGNSGELTEHNLQQIEQAITQLQSDRYAAILQLHYMQGLPMEEVAARVCCDYTTAYRQRERLIHRLAVLMFPDDVIRERFGGVSK